MAKAEKTTTEPEYQLSLAEIEKLKTDIYRPDMEKLQLFTKMLRQNAILKKAVIRHK